MSWASDFDLDAGSIWLNTAHQGALPRVAAQAAREAVEWKLEPSRLTAERFVAVPDRVRRGAARWIAADPADVFLTNGASLGLHEIAQAVRLEAGDDVLLMHGDFPSNVLPWLAHRERGVSVRRARPAGRVLEVEEIRRELRPKTRIVCLSWVHSFSGWTLDIERIGELCRDAGARLIVNVSQGLGARPFDVRHTPVDALVCAGWKWLCGPYGVGFGWLRPEFRAELRPTQRYWLSHQTAEDLGSDRDPADEDPIDTIRRFDLFGTANFFNFHAWGAALDYLLEQGPQAIEEHDRGLVRRLIDGLPAGYRTISPAADERRSTLVLFGHRDTPRNEAIHAGLVNDGIHTAFRRGTIRIAPHLYNDETQVDRLLERLAAAG
ncbi:MAG: aminotransferase class V-fold PLP-dependent enzyme [Acidobacteria bacterium]|nr:aminotransferase class V-fold PLP-dependent enzyme [Acidobacteriota bacterium]NIM60685.1 aminotransferase class V-fold PLP-dependent enzyme [Acidobacteriota bacterium]NIO58645.1 aminotransferase class V-fold PLP-dependent enzyme [Acidobacteriota bacterium]NIQ29701.1 aminotransferase class V-fold PLP-dependent enzyme [Acidobacteriota bacterium]NIQ84418.1 aminotransferase class V-fold PLP-dependent enzyme [Acidobacteriota bacterium]